jgi:hypothetical protein
MRAMGIVELRVGLHDVVQMSQAEAEEVIEAFAFQGADPRLGIAVGNRCLDR